MIHNAGLWRPIINRVAELMEAVGFKPAYMGRYPHEFSAAGSGSASASPAPWR